jgi:hypothetical protein
MKDYAYFVIDVWLVFVLRFCCVEKCRKAEGNNFIQEKDKSLKKTKQKSLPSVGSTNTSLLCVPIHAHTG